MSELERYESVRRSVRSKTDLADFEQKVVAGVSREVIRALSAVFVAYRLSGRPVLLGPAWKDVGTVVAVYYYDLARDYLGRLAQAGDECVVPADYKCFMKLKERDSGDISIVGVTVIGVVADEEQTPAELTRHVDGFVFGKGGLAGE